MAASPTPAGRTAALMIAAPFSSSPPPTSGMALVTEIDLGYFDKLLVAPIRRSSIIFGRLTADLVRGIAASTP